MKQASTTFKWLLLALVALLSLPTMAAVDGEGKYFTQNFEDQSQFPTDTEGKGTNTELKYNTSDGEWIYYNSFSATNASYTSGGTGMNLRLPKSVSASVTTPVLTNGVNKVTFYLGRGTVTVQTSSDGGTTWATATTTTSGKIVTATIESETVNRIKITNSASKDADIDDLSVYAQSFDQPVTVSTGDAADITKTTATISGQITKEEETVTEVGFVWSNTNKEPTLSDNSMAATLAQNFSITLSELAEGKTYYYRAPTRSTAPPRATASSRASRPKPANSSRPLTLKAATSSRTSKTRPPIPVLKARMPTPNLPSRHSAASGFTTTAIFLRTLLTTSTVLPQTCAFRRTVPMSSLRY